MPEIAGNAALLVNPLDSDALSNAILRLATSEELRQELILKGKQRASAFTWQRSADLLWESILKTVES